MTMQIRGQLPEISRYTFGTMSLGSGQYDMAADVKVARGAVVTCVWFYTSADYGDTFRVLRRAFDEERGCVPKIIAKMDAQVPARTRAVVEETLGGLGIEKIDIAQMCWHADKAGIAAEAASIGPRWQTFYDLK